ncbi:MAG TPA: alpha/beta hydrolase [Oligoflexus sp.]|uniref:alpha/beta fold hydrolase n=1 Tax=Oligoflexus sp. TaxID=1971216 RepID=UPI002D70EBA4|nr:alpha/beta hydrolase [Oligoflexus sp.]HYX35306.1 alpha/beta hydrolase [Oligoflexus sp.]
MKCLKSLIIIGMMLLSGCTHAASSPKGLDPELSNYPYPKPVAFFEIQSQQQKLRMAYINAEPKQANGRTVLLLHGKNFSASYWNRTIDSLTAQGYRVIAPDQIGFGKSSKPQSYQYSFHALAEHTFHLLESLQIKKFDVMGHSMGGMLAARLVLMYPSRIGKLILVNPIGLEDWKLHVPYRTVEELYQAELKATPASIREYQRTSYFGGEWKPEYEPLTEILSGWTQHPDYPRVAWNAALTSDMVFTQPVLYEFPLIRADTLLIIGLRDRTAIGKDRVTEEQQKSLGQYPVLGKKAAQAIPRAKLVELEGVGHIPQVEAFDRYIKASLEFLSP